MTRQQRTFLRKIDNIRYCLDVVGPSALCYTHGRSLLVDSLKACTRQWLLDLFGIELKTIFRTVPFFPKRISIAITTFKQQRLQKVDLRGISDSLYLTIQLFKTTFPYEVHNVVTNSENPLFSTYVRVHHLRKSFHFRKVITLEYKGRVFHFGPINGIPLVFPRTRVILFNK